MVKEGRKEGREKVRKVEEGRKEGRGDLGVLL